MTSPLNPDEVAALMGAINEGKVPSGGAANRGPVTSYDLTSQDRIIREQMPTLNAMNEQIASIMSNGLSGRTRLNLRVTSQPANMLKFIDYNGTIEPQCALGVLTLGKGFGPALAVLKPGLPELLLSAALGDRRIKTASSPAEPRREFTSVDTLVLRRLLSILTDAMATVWAPIMPFKPEVLRFETDLRMANISAPSEVAIVSNFDLSGGLEGRLQLVIPYPSVEPVKARLSAPSSVSQAADRRFASMLSRELEEVEVEVRGVLGETKFRLSQLMALKVGDVVILQSDETTPLPIYIQGRPKLAGSPRVSCGSMALTVESDLRAGKPHGAKTPNAA